MSNPETDTSRDWLSSRRTNLLAWWIPLAIILAGLFFPVSLQTGAWLIALAWMGAACILNARRCNRTHCRYGLTPQADIIADRRHAKTGPHAPQQPASFSITSSARTRGDCRNVRPSGLRSPLGAYRLTFFAFQILRKMITSCRPGDGR